MDNVGYRNSTVNEISQSSSAEQEECFFQKKQTLRQKHNSFTVFMQNLNHNLVFHVRVIRKNFAFTETRNKH